MVIATAWLTEIATVAVAGVFGQLPVGALVVIFAEAEPLGMVGVNVAVIVDPDNVCADILPFVAVQFPVVEFPVKVPVTTIVPLEQTDWELGDTVTPLKEFTFIALAPLPGVAVMLPHGFMAFTLIVWVPIGEEELTETDTELVVPPDKIVHPVGKFHW